MKDLKNAATEEHEMNSWVEACMKSKPQFASGEAAVAAYAQELTALAQKYGCTIPQLLTEAENSSSFNEDHLKAMSLWQSLSFYKR